MPTRTKRARAGKREFVVGFAPGGRGSMVVIGDAASVGCIRPFSRQMASDLVKNGMDDRVDRVIYRLVPIRTVRARRGE